MHFENASSFTFILVRIMQGLHMKCNHTLHAFQAWFYCLCFVIILERFCGLKIGHTNWMRQFHEVTCLCWDCIAYVYHQCLVCVRFRFLSSSYTAVRRLLFQGCAVMLSYRLYNLVFFFFRLQTFPSSES
jgi:hypothetical protein